jgi:hypothetical protein
LSIRLRRAVLKDGQASTECHHFEAEEPMNGQQGEPSAREHMSYVIASSFGGGFLAGGTAFALALYLWASANCVRIGIPFIGSVWACR